LLDLRKCRSAPECIAWLSFKGHCHHKLQYCTGVEQAQIPQARAMLEGGPCDHREWVIVLYLKN